VEIKPGYVGDYVIQDHKSKKEHFDLRLQWPDGNLNTYDRKRNFKETSEPSHSKESESVLKSWAVPKHRLPAINERLLAVGVEDHPLEYKDFKGEIPQGLYGAGQVEIYSEGKWELLEYSPEAKIKFRLVNKSLKPLGTFILFKIEDNKWNFMQVEDKEVKRPIVPEEAKGAMVQSKQPPTAWSINEPFSPLPTTIPMETDEENLHQRSPHQFKGRPHGKYWSNMNELVRMLLKKKEAAAETPRAITPEEIETGPYNKYPSRWKIQELKEEARSLVKQIYEETKSLDTPYLAMAQLTRMNPDVQPVTLQHYVNDAWDEIHPEQTKREGQ